MNMCWARLVLNWAAGGAHHGLIHILNINDFFHTYFPTWITNGHVVALLLHHWGVLRFTCLISYLFPYFRWRRSISSAIMSCIASSIPCLIGNWRNSARERRCLQSSMTHLTWACIVCLRAFALSFSVLMTYNHVLMIWRCYLPRFISKCRESNARDPKAKKYIDVLLSSADYETFVRLMKIMRPIALTRIADSKTKSSRNKSHLPDTRTNLSDNNRPVGDRAQSEAKSPRDGSWAPEKHVSKWQWRQSEGLALLRWHCIRLDTAVWLHAKVIQTMQHMFTEETVDSMNQWSNHWWQL